MTGEHLILFQDCKVVDGYYHSIIYDLSRPTNSNKIPLSLSKILSEFEENTIADVLASYPNDSEVIQEYIDFLIFNEFGIIGDDHLKNHLRPLNKVIPTPELIENSIIQITNSNFQTAIDFIEKLEASFCTRLEIRIQDLDTDKFEMLCGLFEDSVIKTISIHSKFNSEEANEMIEISVNKEDRILEHFVHCSPEQKKLEKTNYMTQDVDFIHDCGNIRQENFSINRESFFTNQKFNSCLYKKLSLNFEGKICNCPSFSEERFQDNLSNFDSFLVSPNNTILTAVNKDEIDVCKDCEFRYMCLDCRVYRDTESINSRPSKCEYNPYIGKWKGEKGFVSLNDCGVSYTENGLNIDHNKIAKLNLELWGE